MSRRATVFVLALSAALTATQASADPECFGDTCRMPDVSEPPLAAAPAAHIEPEPLAEAAPAPQAVMRVPSAVQRLAPPPSPLPQMAAEPAVPLPVLLPVARAAVPVEKLAPRPPVPLRVAEPRVVEPRVAEVPVAVEEPKKPVRAAGTARVHHVSPQPYDGGQGNGYVVGVPITTGSIVVAPTVIYGGHIGRPVYLFAPSAKIITVDSGED